MFPTTLMVDSTFLPSTTPTGVSGSAVGWGTVLQAEGRGYDSRWDGVTKIFHWLNPSGRTVTLGSIRLLTEMSIRNLPWGVKVAGAWDWQPYRIHVPSVRKSWELQPPGLYIPVTISIRFAAKIGSSDEPLKAAKVSSNLTHIISAFYLHSLRVPCDSCNEQPLFPYTNFPNVDEPYNRTYIFLPL
jgi:hypothetical protein